MMKGAPALAIAIKLPESKGSGGEMAEYAEYMDMIAESLQEYERCKEDGDWKKCAELICYIHEMQHAVMDMGVMSHGGESGSHEGMEDY